MKSPKAWIVLFVLVYFDWGMPVRLVVAASSPKPNILFIMSDDHAAHALSAYGSKINQTPNLDRIAKNGMLFRNCFVNNSICTPSRAAEAADGVIISQGGGSHGFSLYLKDGFPQFAVRSKGTLAIVSANEKVPLGQWVHLTGILNTRGEIQLRVDGKAVGMAKSGPIAAKPFDKMEVGDDSSNRVSEYGASTAWRGLVEDVRVYWGELDVEKIEAWAGK